MSGVVNPIATLQASGAVAAKQPNFGLVDGVAAAMRMDRYGSVFPWARARTRHGFSEEGSAIVSASNRFFPPGQGIVWQPQTAFNASTPSLLFVNGAAPGGQSIYLDQIKLICTTVATGASSIQWALLVDGPPKIAGNNNLLPLDVQCPNAGLPVMGSVSIFSQQSVQTAIVPSSTATLVGRGNLGGLNAVGTELVIGFGVTSMGAFSGVVETQAGRRASSASPVIVPPQGAAYFYLWAPGSSVSISPELELQMWIR